ncbi:MAG: bifunctional lysylphosphatidylglycerol flippase/synthetase MprF [Pseudoxanthomonas sp.]
MSFLHPRKRLAWIAGLLPWLQRARPWLIGAAVALILALLVHAARGFWNQISYDEMVAAMQAVPWPRLALALLATAVSFAALAGYDHSSLRYAGARVPGRIIAQASTIAYALSNSIGLGVFTGGAVRMRLYGAAGVDAPTVSKAIAFNALAFGLGITTVGAAGLVVDAAVLAPLLRMPAWALRGAGVLVLAAMGGFLWACHARPARLARWPLPAAGLAWRQLLWSTLDIAAAAAVLWCLLPAGVIGFPQFVGFYAAATVLGVVSHVPGGLGVFEAVMLVALGPHVPADALAGALVLYRVVYYLLPLAVAMLLLVRHELARNPAAAPVAQAVASMAPRLLAAFTLVVAVMLLVSGVTPATDQATDLLSLHVPLWMVETSHFLSSVAGVALLFVARAMLERLDAAWWAGLGLALLSVVLALPKGVAVSEALVCSCLGLAIAVSRRQFNRRASLLAVPFSGGWLWAMGAILAAITVLLFFAYRDVDYGNQLWWQFEFDGDAPRSLRAMVGVAVLALALALRQMFKPPRPPLALPDATQLAQAQAVVRAQPSADAGLAMTGDKHLLFSEDGRAFVMFGRQGRSWVVLFDPVGAREQWQGLVRRFLHDAHAAGARGSFYQVRPEALPLYLDMGLRLFKLGEYAWVPLPGFSLQGKRRSNLRNGVNRGEREGLVFELVDTPDVPAVLAQLRQVSDAWLAEQRTAEKKFSVGAFDADYVCRHPVAVVRREGRIVAFATVLLGAPGGEASVDLMRHVGDAPGGTMDFLFVRLLQHFAALGYARFGLGMAPLSGVGGHALAPSWQRLGRMLYTHGENFYNFRGLRAFKEKFDPQWEARYLACPGGVAPLLVLADVAALISGGFKGMIAK